MLKFGHEMLQVKGWMLFKDGVDRGIKFGQFWAILDRKEHVGRKIDNFWYGRDTSLISTKVMKDKREGLNMGGGGNKEAIKNVEKVP